jgi:hypothetical protein
MDREYEDNLGKGWENFENGIDKNLDPIYSKEINSANAIEEVRMIKINLSEELEEDQKT